MRATEPRAPQNAMTKTTHHLMVHKMTNQAAEKPTALDVFVSRKPEIDEMLALLTALSTNHFGVSPDTLNWGDAGSLGFVKQQLKEILQHFGLS